MGGRGSRSFFIFVQLIVTLSAGAARGAAYNFADITFPSGTQPFRFFNAGGEWGDFSVLGGGPINFNFTAATGLGTFDRPATAYFFTQSGVGTNVPATTSGGLDYQPISDFSTFSVIENSTGKRLLDMEFSGYIVGQDGGSDAQFAGQANVNDVIVAFSSDYLNFPGGAESYSFSLASITPALSIGPGGYLNTFNADLSGQFTADATAVPEPACAALFALGSLVLFRRR